MPSNLPDTPISSGAVLFGLGVLGVTGYFIRKSSADRQHLVDTQLELKKIDAEQTSKMVEIVKEMAENKRI